MRIAPWLAGIMVVAVGTSALGQFGTFRGQSAAATRRPTDTFGRLGGTYTGASTGRRLPGASVATVPRASSGSFGYRSLGGGAAGFTHARGMVGQAFQYAPTAGGATSAGRLGWTGYTQYATPQSPWGQRALMPGAAGPQQQPVPAGAAAEDDPATVKQAAALPKGPTAGQAADRRMSALRNDYLRQAILRFRDGEYKRARALFEIVDAIEFTHGFGQLGTVHAFFADGQYDSAIAALMPLLDGGVNLFERNFVTTLYSDPATFAGQLARFRPVIAASTAGARIQALGAYLLWANGEHRAAVMAAQRAYQSDPTEARYRKLLQMITKAERALADAATASK